MPGQALWNVRRTMTTAQDGSQIHFASLRWICTSPGAKEGIGRLTVSPCHEAASCRASIPVRENAPERSFEAREVACRRMGLAHLDSLPIAFSSLLIWTRTAVFSSKGGERPLSETGSGYCFGKH